MLLRSTLRIKEISRDKDEGESRVFRLFPHHAIRRDLVLSILRKKRAPNSIAVGGILGNSVLQRPSAPQEET